MKAEILEKRNDLLTKIYDELHIMCDQYHLNFNGVVQVGKTHELVRLVSGQPLPDVWKVMPEICDIEKPFFPRMRMKSYGKLHSLVLFIKVDSIYHLVKCCDDFDKLTEMMVLRTRIEFSKIYFDRRMHEDKKLADVVFDHIGSDIHDFNDMIKDCKSYEERASKLYAENKVVKMYLDLTHISREAYIKCAKLMDEIIGFDIDIVK